METTEDKEVWYPRWYYIKQNVTSGKKYIGQTKKKNLNNYKGSGYYWMAHCKKHGGYIRNNIITLESWWVETKTEAESLCRYFQDTYGEYWLEGQEDFANNIPENAENQAMAGISTSATQRAASSAASKGGKHMTEEQKANNRAAVIAANTNFTIHSWINDRDGRTFSGTKQQFKVFLLPRGEWISQHIGGVIRGIKKQCKGWRLTNPSEKEILNKH